MVLGTKVPRCNFCVPWKIDGNESTMFVFFCTLPDDTEMDVRALDRIMHEIDFAAVDRPHVSVRQSVALLLLSARALVR